jgi:hypothetical protein
MTQLIWISGGVDRVAGALAALLAAGFRRPAGFRRLDLAVVRAVFFGASCFLGLGTGRLLSAK